MKTCQQSSWDTWIQTGQGNLTPVDQPVDMCSKCVDQLLVGAANYNLRQHFLQQKWNTWPVHERHKK